MKQYEPPAINGFANLKVTGLFKSGVVPLAMSQPFPSCPKDFTVFMLEDHWVQAVQEHPGVAPGPCVR